MPDKCPVCDTRKYEIIQEIKLLEEEEQAPAQPIQQIIASPPQESAVQEPVVQEQVVVSEETHVTQVEAFQNNMPAVVVEEQDPISDIVCYDDDSDDEVIFKENISLEEELSAPEDRDADIVFSNSQDGSSDVVFQGSTNEDVVFDDVIFEEKTSSSPRKPRKTGASALEVLPDKEKGFPKGNYLVLFNAEKKAIAYFKIDQVGSIIIGRSSERGSPNDIDLTMAWKQAYKDQYEESQAFREKMKMVKGISRKHALIRYDENKKCYVFFHLSDKNYTIVKTRQGEKRERPPKNRNPIYLEPGSLISMGNHKNYIIMRFKKID